jgi:hypothetical protein
MRMRIYNIIAGKFGVKIRGQALHFTFNRTLIPRLVSGAVGLPLEN